MNTHNFRNSENCILIVSYIFYWAYKIKFLGRSTEFLRRSRTFTIPLESPRLSKKYLIYSIKPSSARSSSLLIKKKTFRINLFFDHQTRSAHCSLLAFKQLIVRLLFGISRIFPHSESVVRNRIDFLRLPFKY